MIMDKLLSALEVVAARDQPLTLAELASALNAPRPSVHRWLGTLVSAGMLQRAPDGRRLELAPRASQLAFSILANRPGSALRHAILKRVAQDLGEACNLTVLHGAHVTYIDRVETAWALRIMFQRGSQVPVHCSASGKLFLAFMPSAKRGALLNSLALERFTENTVTERDALVQQCKEIRKQGYAVDREEYLTGLVCLAVPVLQKVGRARSCVAAVAVQAPVARLNSEQLLGTLPRMQAAAAALAASLDLPVEGIS